MSPSGNRKTVRWANLFFVLLGMLLALGTRHAFVEKRIEDGAAPHVFTRTNVAGSWGTLRETPLMLDPPPQFFRDYNRTQEIRWTFAGLSVQELRSLIQTLGLAQRQRASLLDQSHWQIAPEKIVLRPPLDVLRHLEPGPRQKLYDVLARTPHNMAQRFPFVLQGSFEDRFADCRASLKTLQELRRMIYRKNGVSLFADLLYFQLTAPSNDVVEIARCVARVSTLFVELELNQQTDLQGLQRYWVLPERHTEVEPLLNALAAVPGGCRVDVSSFMPAVPQFLLQTFPRPREKDFPRNANCVWSSMNFFNTQPDHRFIEEQFTGAALNSQYYLAPRADAFGDIIMLYRPEPNGGMDMVHMCVHIADDLVFTKNGGDIFQPWVLMRLADVKGLFVTEGDLRTAVFRRRT